MNPIIAKGRALAAAVGLRRESAPAVRAGDGHGIIRTSAAYMHNALSPLMMKWNPVIRDTQEDVRQAWAAATARATDTIQNSGWISGGITSSVGQVLGSGLRLKARPDTTVVKFEGLKADDGQDIDADGWARFVERRWEAYSNSPIECDAVGRQTIAEMTEAAYRTWFATGEIVATIPHRNDPLSISKTKVLLIAPHRLVQKSDPTKRMIQGVRMDEYGRPYAYVFRSRNALGIEVDTEVLARDAAGRPQVIHVYQGLPGQVRGITPLVPALQVTRQYDQLANATLTAALIQTIFAATVESDAPTAEILNALSTEDDQGVGGNIDNFLAARMGWHQSTNIDLNDQSRIAHLFPGETLKFNRSEHPNSAYEAFARFLLREIARCVGVTFEQLSGDYTGVTYTGVRMSGSEIWQLVLNRRKHIAGKFLQPIYEAWLEEEIETGRIKFPGGVSEFIRLRAAAARADWRGPPKLQADDLKAAKAHQTYREMGVVSDGMIADDLGVDIEDVYEERKREKGLREKFELEDMGPSAGSGIIEDGDVPDEPDGPVPPKPTRQPGSAALV